MITLLGSCLFCLILGNDTDSFQRSTGWVVICAASSAQSNKLWGCRAWHPGDCCTRWVPIASIWGCAELIVKLPNQPSPGWSHFAIMVSCLQNYTETHMNSLSFMPVLSVASFCFAGKWNLDEFTLLYCTVTCFVIVFDFQTEATTVKVASQAKHLNWKGVESRWPWGAVSLEVRWDLHKEPYAVCVWTHVPVMKMGLKIDWLLLLEYWAWSMTKVGARHAGKLEFRLLARVRFDWQLETLYSYFEAWSLWGTRWMIMGQESDLMDALPDGQSRKDEEWGTKIIQ